MNESADPSAASQATPVPPVFLCGIGIVVIVGLGIADAILTIIAAITASSGKPYRYPMCMRFVK
jgi:uncharacterized Tic20 family protein